MLHSSGRCMRMGGQPQIFCRPLLLFGSTFAVLSLWLDIAAFSCCTATSTPPLKCLHEHLYFCGNSTVHCTFLPSQGNPGLDNSTRHSCSFTGCYICAHKGGLAGREAFPEHTADFRTGRGDRLIVIVILGLQSSTLWPEQSSSRGIGELFLEHCFTGTGDTQVSTDTSGIVPVKGLCHSGDGLILTGRKSGFYQQYSKASADSHKDVQK